MGPTVETEAVLPWARNRPGKVKSRIERRSAGLIAYTAFDIVLVGIASMCMSRNTWNSKMPLATKSVRVLRTNVPIDQILECDASHVARLRVSARPKQKTKNKQTRKDRAPRTAASSVRSHHARP